MHDIKYMHLFTKYVTPPPRQQVGVSESWKVSLVPVTLMGTTTSSDSHCSSSRGPTLRAEE